jgi:hypothetical protein
MWLSCLFRIHNPSRALVRARGFGYISVCGRCGAPMTKQSDGEWTVAKK